MKNCLFSCSLLFNFCHTWIFTNKTSTNIWDEKGKRDTWQINRSLDDMPRPLRLYLFITISYWNILIFHSVMFLKKIYWRACVLESINFVLTYNINNIADTFKLISRWTQKCQSIFSKHFMRLKNSLAL